ncbi:NtaA/DmoA family FMN-dependent monooxygenase [Pseudarthrobacter sp. fls2-241-R2A-168]|uniref:NtaA/DmoA family FMN-dependent monooxygenase n=1 Tax=Pseudarthrobacter sp. fls2-241-R2A-168 TaxID=3040304 RepID=UPI0025560AD2|nr:NtaA/DmoA family FMN-dependent monooxygenase [Pseudarthrobacter sp. fls2-241-R2A-168]
MGTEHITVCAMPHAGGWHQASWRRKGAKGNDIWNPELWKDIARTAERGMLDAVFFADNSALWGMPEHLRKHTAKVGVWDATILAALAASATERIGIVATAQTEYQQPYILARQMACLDHLSGGRIGWNIVTSAFPLEAQNHGEQELADKELRYAKATEFVEVVKSLWDSWEDDAYVIDQESGIFFDPDKLHTPNHKGEFFSVRGPLNVMRPPQGYPVFAQAGSSGSGKVLAGTVAELVFTNASGEAAAAYRNDIHSIAAQAGRKASDVKVLSMLCPVIAPTDEEAQAKWVELQRMLHPDLQRNWIEIGLGDTSGYSLDEPLPEKPTATSHSQGFLDAVYNFRMPDGRKPTFGELLENYPGPGTVVGSPSTIADYMENEIDSGACDGFILTMQGVPEELEDFVNFVVPELQKRGRFRTSYGEEMTFRELLGLPRPENQFSQKPITQEPQSA